MEKQATYTTTPTTDDNEPSVGPTRCLIYEDGRYTWGELPVGIGFGSEYFLDECWTVKVHMRPGAAWWHSATYRFGHGPTRAIVFRAKDPQAELRFAAVYDGAPVAFRHRCFLVEWLVRTIRDHRTIEATESGEVVI